MLHRNKIHRFVQPQKVMVKQIYNFRAIQDFISFFLLGNTAFYVFLCMTVIKMPKVYST